MITYFDLLVPLGLLGLLGILALIIIYIIRPNYQVKHVSTTFVWKLSMKYRKKRPPTSKLRNFLIFLCQILALTSIAGILAMPAIVHENEIIAEDTIAIIDSSASMNTLTDGESRFQRAVDEVIQLSDSVFSGGGSMSVILADDTPSFLGRRVSTAAARLELSDALDELLYDDMGCSYGSCDVEATMELCEEILSENPSTKIYFYTDTTYLYVPEGIEVVPVTNQNEWNAAILNATATLEDGYYVLTVEVATYGQDLELELNVQVEGANPIDSDDVGTEIEFSDAVFCNRDTTKTFVFRQFTADLIIPDDENIRYYDLGLTQRFYSFSAITISINEMDSFREDNNFYIYGGRKEPIKIQYSSSMSTAADAPGPNPFVNNILGTLKKSFKDRFDFQVTEVRQGAEPALQGFDFYIFEHNMPQTLPNDGVVLLFDPDIAPKGSGLTVGVERNYQTRQMPFSEEMAHPMLEHIVADNITVSRFRTVRPDANYEILLSCDTSPVVMVSKSEMTQIAVFAFSVHNSNISRTPEWLFLWHNLFEYYLPATVTGNAFEVGEEIKLNSRGPQLIVDGEEEPITEFPTTITKNIPGPYRIQQSSYFKDLPDIDIFVKVPARESNIFRTEDSLEGPSREVIKGTTFDDLMVYLAAALVALLFLEWWLQSRENK